MQVDKGSYFRAQQLRRGRHRKIIDSTVLVAFEPIDIAHANSGNEYDGRIFESRMLVNHLCCFKTIHARHAHVHQHERDGVLQQLFQGLHSGMSLDQVFTQFTESRFIGEQFGGLIIYQQYV